LRAKVDLPETRSTDEDDERELGNPDFHAQPPTGFGRVDAREDSGLRGSAQRFIRIANAFEDNFVAEALLPALSPVWNSARVHSNR
jgi:hypothetical protein